LELSAATDTIDVEGYMAEYEHILYEVRDKVAIITMNHPERLNSMDRSMGLDMARALRAADADEGVRAIIWTGSGRAFSSGGDQSGDADAANGVTNESLSTANAWDWYRFLQGPHGTDASFSARSVHKPLIAAVNGLCYGAAVMRIATCDIVLASDQATFCMIEARMGFVASSTLPFLIGPQWTKILVLTGEKISARRAERIGLVAAVVPHDDLLERALNMGRRIAAMPHFAVMLNKAHTDGTLDMMGWAANERFSLSHGAVVQAMSPWAEAADGRLLNDILEKEGFRAYINARDAAFKEPLFPDDE
jgi:enoyl-CoA hydratase/carnithine racemase